MSKRSRKSLTEKILSGTYRQGNDDVWGRYIEKDPQKRERLVKPDGKCARAERFVKFWEKHMNEVVLDEEHGSYTRSSQKIGMPERDMFLSHKLYYWVFFHEVAHAAIHMREPKKRKNHDRNSPEYAEEEMQAEIFSLYLYEHTVGRADEELVWRASSYVRDYGETAGGGGSEVLSCADYAEKLLGYVLRTCRRQRLLSVLRAACGRPAALYSEKAVPGAALSPRVEG